MQLTGDARGRWVILIGKYGRARPPSECFFVRCDVEPSEARDILQALADGIDPQTGEVLHKSSPCQHPQVVRALYTAVHHLASKVDRQTKTRKLPPQAGKAWTAAEDQKLVEAFKQHTSLSDLAKAHRRTRGAIQSRLERHGLIELRKTLAEPT